MEPQAPRQPYPHREKLLQIRNDILNFLRNPVEAIRRVPDWDWPMLVVFYSGAAAACGFIGGVLSTHIAQMFSGLIFMPIMWLIAGFIASGLIYYTLTFFFHRTPPFRQISTVVVYASMPAIVLSIVSRWVPVISVVGLLISGLLLIVGISENFQVNRLRVAKFVGALYVLYLGFFIYNSIKFQAEKEKYKSSIATPDSRELLKHEFDQKQDE